jgi:branched-chain amino acid transport system permease protein
MLLQSPARVRQPEQAVRSRTATWAARVIAGLFAVFAVVTIAAGPSYAAEDDRVVQGTLLNTAKDNEPVPGVTIIVTSSDGGSYSAKSDADGKFKITVPAKDAGTLTVKLDTSTLPEGVDLRAGSSDTRKPTGASPTSWSASRSARTSAGGDQARPGPAVDLQRAAVRDRPVPRALGLSMVFGTTGLTNFAHGELVTFGAIMTYLANRVWGLPIVVSILFAVVLSAAFGWLNDSGLWRPLRRRGTGLIAMMIVSIGLQFLLRNIYQYFTGGRSLTYREYVTPEPHTLGFIDYTYRDLILVAVSLLVLLAVTLALQYTRLGRATRAVADNPALAASTGINVNRVISTVWIVGTALAGLGGAFLGFSTVGDLPARRPGAAADLRRHLCRWPRLDLGRDARLGHHRPLRRAVHAGHPVAAQVRRRDGAADRRPARETTRPARSIQRVG